MKLTLRYILTFAALQWMQTVFGQEFSINIATKEIGRRDELQVEYVINGSNKVTNFTPPYFKDWHILSGPSFASMSSNINGKRQSSSRYVYILKPERAGEVKLPGTSVEVDGKILSCSEVTVTVMKQDHLAATPAPNSLSLQHVFTDETQGENLASESVLKPGENIRDKVRKNLFVKAFVSKKKCYVGEPVLVTYKLYSRLNTRSRVVKQPGFSAATVLEMTTDNDGIEKRETINGKEYRSYVIRRVQLLPLQAGVVTVGQTAVENNISFYAAPSSTRDLFYDAPRTEEHTVTVSNEPVNIEVIDLPAAAVNKKFNGAVGHFQVFTKLKKDTIASNETNLLWVIVSGEGNFNSVSLPQINWGKNIYHFDEIVTEEIDKLQFPASGKKIFEIPFECTERGKLQIPVVSFTFFNPATDKYETVATKPLYLIVTNAAVKKMQQQTTTVKDSGISPKYLFFLIPLVFAIGSIFIWLRRNKTKKPALTAVYPASADAVMRESCKPGVNFSAEYSDLLLIQNDHEFYNKAREIADNMIKNNIGNKKMLTEVLKNCNEALYTPIIMTGKKEVLDKLQQAYAGDAL